MTAPVTPYLVSGRVRDRLGNLLSGATITLTHSSINPVLSITTNSKGEYILNLGDLASQWIRGDTITLFSSVTGEGRLTVTTTIKNVSSQTENLNLEETSDLVFQPFSLNRYPLHFLF